MTVRGGKGLPLSLASLLGRVVSNFIVQTLRGHPLTVYSPGNQTRSFMYVSDLVDGLMKLMNSNYSLPVNLVSSTILP